MLTTFGQAKKSLAPFTGAYQLGDIGSAINMAVDELASSRNWQQLKQTRRFTATGEFFAVPQDCESVIRCAVDGKPVSVRGADYEFLHSGPGDLDFLPVGYAPANGLQDLGYFATMYDFTDGSGLVCFGTADAPEGDIRIRGRNLAGDVMSGTVPYQKLTSMEDVDDPVALTVTPLTGFTFVDRVILPADAGSYISMYATLSGAHSFVSRMHPSIKVPEFRRYRLPGFSAVADASYRILAEIRLRAMPLIEDDDALPFDSILPVQYMLTSMWNMSSGEVKTANDYRQSALALLLGREEAKQERQGLLVVNALYDGSLGQMSEQYDNI
jgi:hypothetical protein